MKKITFLLCFMTMMFGYAQTDLIENFDGAMVPGYVPENNGCPASGALSMTTSTAQAASGANSLEIISNAAGNPWQGAELLLQNPMDLTTNKVITVDVYSTVPAGILAKVTAGGGPGTSAANHTGGGWETLTFDLSDEADGAGIANGVYTNLIFYPLWGTAGGYAGQGTNPCVSAAPNTIYIDNIIGTAPTGPNCGDGIMNGNETGVDCGGPDCPACPPPAPPSDPTEPNAQVYSIYNDTNGYTTTFPFAYVFGSVAGEPDLDPGAGVNLALQFDFTVAGFGNGEGGPDDVSAYNFVSFDYYAEPGSVGFQFRMIDNDGAVEEFVYEIGTNEAVVTGAWTKVVIPMSYFTGIGFDSTNFFQWKFDPFMQSVAQGSTVWVDNLILSTGDPLSVNSVEATEFVTFPNPTKDSWNITSNNVIKTVVVYDVLGKQVASLSPSTTEVEIDGSTLTQGLYFARIEGENGSETVKLIKE